MGTKIKPAIHQKVVALLHDSLAQLSHKQIAEITGTSVSYVQKTWGEVKDAHLEAQEDLEAYQRHLRVQLPPEKRAEIIRELTEQTDQHMVRLKAVQYLDEMVGHVSARAQRKSPEDERPAPMFNFPEGSRPVIVVGAMNRPRDEQSPAPEPEDSIDAEVKEIEE